MVATPHWVEVTRGILDVAQVAAILGAAGWAYFKFVRGRTFAERLEASVHATPFRRDGMSGLRIRTGLTNTGASIVRLKDGVKVVYVYGTPVADAVPGMLPQWGQHLLVVSVFTRHKWIEAQETVSDEALAIVPDRRWLGYRIELIVASRKNKRWTANTVIPAPRPRGMEKRHTTAGLGGSGSKPTGVRSRRVDAR
jgi:hypothetical protein